jgi:membrane fusion protein, multidrug efflux system
MSAMQQVGASGGSSRSSRWILIAVAVVVVLGGLWFAMHRGGEKPAATPEKTAKEAAGPLELASADVVRVELRALSRSLPLSGSLLPLVQTTVKAKVAGEVLDMAVREGQSVKRGDLLAHIDIKNLKAQYDSQAAALEKARADWSIAKTNLDNNRVMLEQHFISKNAFDSASSTYEAAAASVRA